MRAIDLVGRWLYVLLVCAGLSAVSGARLLASLALWVMLFPAGVVAGWLTIWKGEKVWKT